jgi:hypothetical protein
MTAGSLAGGLFKMMSGDPNEKYRKMGLRDTMEMRNYKGIDPDEMVFRRMQSFAPRQQQMAEGLGRKFGIDSGRLYGALGQNELDQRGDTYADTLMQNEQMRNRMRMFAAQNLMNYGR